jgi:hypothetical protein
MSGASPTATSARLQMLCAAGGFVAPALALAALFGSGVFPPHAAHHSAVNLARFYAHHHNLKMAGLFLGFLAVSLLGPLVAVIGLQMTRIEGPRPLLSILQLVAGAVTWVLLSVPLLILFVAAYRANRDPQITQTLHDLGWILFLIPIGPFIVQNLAIATAILTDEHPQPVLPRWVAWINLAIASSFLPDALLGFFKAGPFAYQGIFSFWIPTITYGIWLNVMAYACIHAIGRDTHLHRPAIPVTSLPALA